MLGRAQDLEGQDEADDGDQVGEVARVVRVKETASIRRRPRWSRAPAAGAARPRRPAPAPWPARSRLGLEHLEHAVGHHEAADHVQRGQEDGEEAEDQLGRPVGLAHDRQGADQHDAVDGVGARHQRGVQDARDLRDDLDADEGGQHEDGQVRDDAGGRPARRRRLQQQMDHDGAPGDAAPRPPPSSSTAAGATAGPRAARTCRPRSRRPSPVRASPRGP